MASTLLAMASEESGEDAIALRLEAIALGLLGREQSGLFKKIKWASCCEK